MLEATHQEPRAAPPTPDPQVAAGPTLQTAKGPSY